MAKVIHIVAPNLATLGTQYALVGTGGLGNSSTETNAHVTYRTAGTLSKLKVYISANSTTATSNIRVRKNGANGNQVVSPGSGATGPFEDASNTDTVAAGDEVAYSIAPGSGHTLTAQFFSTLFDADSNTVQKIVSSGSSLTTASVTRYCRPTEGSAITAETFQKAKCYTAATFKNFAVNVTTNNRTTTTTFRVRINGANGNLNIPVEASVTGIIEDTTNTDSVASNDLFNYSLTTGTGTETLAWASITLEVETTNNKFSFFRSSGTNVTPGLTRHVCLGAAGTLDSSEVNARVPMGIGGTLSKFHINVSGNSLSTAATNITVRKDGADTAITIPVSAGATGEFEETAQTATFTATSECNYRVVVDAGGTGNMTIATMSLLCENTDVAAGGARQNLALLGVGA